MADPLGVNTDRLEADLESLAQIGRRDGSGIHRTAFSEGDMAGRQWLADRLEEAGLSVRLD
ncbi:MAG TPA: Zn-dependent hydrolase, partial [Myxococcota bacterium]|nr:Zn-dependent hydrolase [Myxococcota bacterium]